MLGNSASSWDVFWSKLGRRLSSVTIATTSHSEMPKKVFQASSLVLHPQEVDEFHLDSPSQSCVIFHYLRSSILYPDCCKACTKVYVASLACRGSSLTSKSLQWGSAWVAPKRFCFCNCKSTALYTGPGSCDDAIRLSIPAKSGLLSLLLMGCALSQAAACDGNNYTRTASEQDITPVTLPIYWNTNC